MKKIILTMLVLTTLMSPFATAGWLVTEATIKEVSNTAGNQNIFYIVVDGGNGICADKEIRFPRSTAASDAIYEMAFAIALAAYASGEKVKVYDYSEGNESCGDAESIRIYR